VTEIERLRKLIADRASLPAVIFAENDAAPLVPLMPTTELETALAIREVGAELVKALREISDV
jgi:hypothetical protein